MTGCLPAFWPDAATAPTLRVTLVMAAYRDSRIAAWLYTGPGAKQLRDAGFSTVVVPDPTPGHTDYRQLGFRDVDGALVRRL